MNLDLVRQYLLESGQPSYRFSQIQKSYYSGSYNDFSQLTDLPLELRRKLTQKFNFFDLKQSSLSTDHQTQKALLSLNDGLKIESVLMPYSGWYTACISSQVGCPLGCRFCATGQMGFKRHLTVSEIVDQLLFWNYYLKPSYVGRLVIMGMGEPFLNWDNLLSALKTITDPDGLNYGDRKISLSTIGIIPKIIEFANLKNQINLAVSLHSAISQSRVFLMPATIAYPLSELIPACLYYVNHTHRQLFFEYALIQGVNDNSAHLRALIKMLNSHPLFFLNLINLHPTPSQFLPSSPNIQKFFIDNLRRAHINFTIRRSFGSNINAACGQLATSSG